MSSRSELSEHLKKTAAAGTVSHAYLICGDREEELSALALEFARQLIGSPLPHPDVISLTHEKEELISVDEVRNGIVETAQIRPYEASRKIFLIPEAEKMNEAAQNALLKTLEEPPSYAVLLLLTTNENALLSTIRSRCEVLYLAADGREGSREYGDLFGGLSELSVSEIRSEVRSVSESRTTASVFLTELQDWIRDLMYHKSGMPKESLLFTEYADVLAEQAECFSNEALSEISSSITKATERIASNVNTESTLELLLLRIREKAQWQRS